MLVHQKHLHRELWTDVVPVAGTVMKVEMAATRMPMVQNITKRVGNWS